MKTAVRINSGFTLDFLTLLPTGCCVDGPGFTVCKLVRLCPMQDGWEVELEGNGKELHQCPDVDTGIPNFIHIILVLHTERLISFQFFIIVPFITGTKEKRCRSWRESIKTTSRVMGAGLGEQGIYFVPVEMVVGLYEIIFIFNIILVLCANISLLIQMVFVYCIWRGLMTWCVFYLKLIQVNHIL